MLTPAHQQLKKATNLVAFFIGLRRWRSNLWDAGRRPRFSRRQRESRAFPPTIFQYANQLIKRTIEPAGRGVIAGFRHINSFTWRRKNGRVSAWAPAYEPIPTLIGSFFFVEEAGEGLNPPRVRLSNAKAEHSCWQGLIINGVWPHWFTERPSRESSWTCTISSAQIFWSIAWSCGD